MSDYPNYSQLVDDSQPQLAYANEQLTAEDGTPLAIIRGDALRRTFPLHHRITDAQFQTILALFRQHQRVGNQPLSFTFTSDFDGVEYNAYFGAEPSRRKIGPDLYDVNVLLVEAP